MATDYSIRFEGTGTQNDLLVDDIISAEVNLTETAMSDFSASIPKDDSLRDYLQQPVVFEDDFTGETVWYGTLEQWNEGETDIAANVSGRGPLLAEKQSSTEVTYTSAFADDTLEQYVNTYGTTEFQFETSDQDVRVKDTTITNDGEGATGTFENQVQIPAYQDKQFTEWEIAVKYAEPKTSSTVGVSDTAGGADETTTLSEDEARDEWIHTGLTAAGETGTPYVYVDIDSSSNNIVHIVAFPSDSSQRYIVSEKVNGDVLSGIQSLAEIAGYRFGPLNYNNRGTSNPTHLMFPIGYETGEPEWRVLDANRATDFSGYANKVTVRGAQKNGTYYSATVEDDEEIALINKEIEKYEKRVDLESNAECRAVAKTMLSSSVQNRGESGDLVTTIPTEKSNVPIGATTPLSVWNETFNDGGMVGPDALYFQQKDSATERVRTNSWDDSASTYSISVNIYPHLDELNRDAYIFSNDYAPEFLVLEQDGTLRATNPAGASTSTTIVAEEIIENRTTQTITLTLDGSSFQMQVDGEIVASTSTSEGYVMDPDGQVFGNRHRDTFRDDGFRVATNGTVNLTWDEVSESGGVFQNYGESYSVDTTELDTNWTKLNPGSSAYREGVSTSGTSTGPRFEIAHDASLDIGTGDLSAATWFKIDSTSTEYFLIEKGGFNATTEGWCLTVRNGDLFLEVSDGSTQESHTIATGLSADTWYHTGFAIDNSQSLVEGYLNGVKELSATYGFAGTDVSNSNQSLSMLNTLTGGEQVAMDETRVWLDFKQAPDFELLSSLGPVYSDVFRGGIDEIKFDNGLNGTTTYYPLDFDESPDTAVDTVGGFDALIYNVEYAAVSAPTREITYSFSNDVTANVKFDIQGRIDTELANVRVNVENIKQ